MSQAQPSLPDLPRELNSLLSQIPYGRVATYGDLADALGSRQAARWVGEFLLHHPHDERCPCHRVVRQTGEPGRFIGGEREKALRLKRESVKVFDGRVDLERFRFNDFASNRTLADLVQFQEELPRRTKFTPYRKAPRYVGGIDMAYDAEGLAIAAYALVNVETGQLDWSTTARSHVAFPYIPGLLSFRESPAMLELLAQVRELGRLADVVIVDGNGLLHPRCAGIACHVGVLADARTIGIGKKLLCGSVDLYGMKVDDQRPVSHGERTVGMAVKAGPGSRPIFVSPGHKIDTAGAVRIVRRLFFGHRVPEPIYLADALSKKAARPRSASLL